MTTFESGSATASPLVHVAGLLSAAGRRLRAGIAGRAEVRRMRRDIRILHGLSDWELRDIGLVRSDLPRLQALWRLMRLGDGPPAL